MLRSLLTCLFSETSVGEERSEAATDQCQSCFVMCDRLQIQFVDSNLCMRERFQLGEPTVVVNMRVSQKDVSQVRRLNSRLLQSIQ